MPITITGRVDSHAAGYMGADMRCQPVPNAGCSASGTAVACPSGEVLQGRGGCVSLRLRALVAATLGTLTLPFGVAAASAPSQLRVVAAYDTASQTDVVVAVPRELARLALPRSAFAVRQDGQPLLASVQRVSDVGLSVYIVLDVTPANTALRAEQSAAADLLRQLPATVRTAVATSQNDVQAAQPGNVAALRTLSAVKPNSSTVVETTLNRIVTSSRNDERRLIVLMTSCPADSQIDISPLKAALGRGTSQLNIVTFGGVCSSRLIALARVRGGMIGMPAAPSQLAAAVDDIAYDTLGQYRISLPTSSRARQITVMVRFAGIGATSEVRLPTSGQGAPVLTPNTSTPASAAPGTPRHHSLPSWFPVAAMCVLAGLILAACAVAALQVKRRATRKPRPKPSSGLSPPPTAPSPRRPGDGGRSPQSVAEAIAYARGQPAQLERAGLPQIRVDGLAASRPLAASERPTQPEPEAPAARVPTPDAAPEVERVAKETTTRSDPSSEPPPVAATEASRHEEHSDAPRNRQLVLPASGLNDGTIRVRLPQREDAAQLHALAETEVGLADDWVPSPADASTPACQTLVNSWFRKWNNAPAAADLGLVIERTSHNGIIGFIGLRLDAGAVSVTYGIAPPYRRRGYATRALRLVANWLAQQERVGQVEARISLHHEASRAVARAVGFVPAGVQFFDATTRLAVSNALFVFEPAASAEHMNPTAEPGNPVAKRTPDPATDT